MPIRTKFAGEMHALGHVFDTEVTTIRVGAYFNALEEHLFHLVCAAMRQTHKTCRFFPKPVEILELIDGTDVEAWAEVIREVRRVGYYGLPRFTNPATMPAVRALFGTWKDLCERLPEPGPEQLGWRKRFAAAFATCSARDQQQRALAEGSVPKMISEAMSVLAEQKAFPTGRKR